MEQQLNSSTGGWIDDDRRDEADFISVSQTIAKTIVSGSLNIGDTIRDLEDADCFYEGTIVSLNPIKYKVTNIIWSGEKDESLNGAIIELKWWIVQVLKNGKFVEINYC